MNTLYTYGGGHLLYNVFNGVAYLTNPDLPFWGIILGFSTLIGLMWASVMALSKVDVGLFVKKWFLPSFILLNALLLPRASLHIVDEVDPTFMYDKVDNLPVGLVGLIGVTSLCSRALVEAYESVFETADLVSMTKTGFAFSSRLMKEARMLRIADPRIRQNIKDWADQCIWLPYLKTNIGGKKEAVRKSDDLIAWVEANGHPSLGTYWRNEDGSKTYQTCRASAASIREAMTVQGERGFKNLGAKLFGFKPAEGGLEGFKPKMQKAWQLMSNSTKTASHNVQQMMVVNAQKEAFDDSRERYKYPRLHPELVSMNAARALETQGMTGMMSALTSSVTMPLLQATMIGLLSMLFVMIVGFYFLPGGLKKLALFAKLMFSFQMWPVLSSMLNSLSLFWLKNSSETVLQGSEGFSIATTSGLSDAAWSVGTWAAGMQLMVPVLAWGIVSGSPYVLSSILGGLTSSLQGLAGKYAGEAADGNLSMGNQNLMNETIASRSVAQQNHVGSSNFAGTLNTGSQTITNGIDDSVFIGQQQDTLDTNISSNKALNATTAESAREAKQLMHSDANTFTKAVTESTADVESLVHKHGQGISLTDGLTERDAAGFNETLDNIKSSTDSLRKNHNLGAQTAINGAIALNSSGSLVGKIPEKLLGLSGKVDLSGQAIDSEAFDKAMNSDEGQRLSANLSKLRDYSKSFGAQTINSTGKDATASLAHNMTESGTAATALNRSYTASQNWDKVQSFTDTQGLTVQHNENDPWLNYVSAETGLNKVDAAAFVSNSGNGSKTSALQEGFIASKKADLKQFVSGSDHLLTNEEIANWKSPASPLNPSGGEGRALMQGAIAQQGFKSHEALKMNYDLMEQKTEAALNRNAGSIDRGRDELTNAHANQDNRFTQEGKKTNARRFVAKGAQDFVTGSVTKAILDDFLPKKD